MRFPCLVMVLLAAAPVLESRAAESPATGLPTPAPSASVPVTPVAGGGSFSAAQDGATRAFLSALAAAPQVRALVAERQALRHLEGVAGRLADPQLGLGYARKRTPMEHMPMYELSLEQPLPRWGERDAARAMAASATRMSEAGIASEVAQLAGEIATELAELDGLQAQLSEGEAQSERLVALARVLDARVASGDASVLDRLMLDTRRERLALRLDDLRRQVADRSAAIRGRLALAPTDALPAFTAPLPDQIDPAQTPLALAAAARREEATAQLQAARAMGHPETAVGVRAEREATDGGNEDTIGVTVSISLPLARGAIDAGEEAAHARLRVAERQAEAARWRATTAVDSARRAIAQAERADRLAENLLTRAHQEHKTVNAALATGGADLTAVLDLHDHLAELRLAVIEARVQAAQARAGLWSLVIPELPMPGAAP